MKFYSIAIDGPAGAGKSTIAKEAAKVLGFTYIDTGAMYRALGLFYLNNNVDLSDEGKVVSMLDEIDVTIKYIDGTQHVYLNGEDVSALIRTPKIGEAASSVSVYRDVRKKLVSLQQKLALSENVIMDGRDIASVVLPKADLKIYLNASVEVRAKRRFDELTAKGNTAVLSEIEKEIAERDYRDMHRQESPLVCVPEAINVDTSFMSIEEVSAEIIDLFRKVEAADCK